MRHTGPVLLALVGLINLIPVTGVISAARIERLYAIAVAGPDLEVLLRHRAILLGLVGLLLIAAALLPPLRVAAIVAGFASMGSFLMIAAMVGDTNAALARVVTADVVGCALLAAAALLLAWTRSRPPGRGAR